MSILKWFDAREAKSFGTSLANIVIERSPKLPDTLTEKQLKKIADSMFFQIDKQIVVFKKNHALNVYTKAQMGNSFKWQLLENNYPKEFANQLTAYLLHKC